MYLKIGMTKPRKTRAGLILSNFPTVTMNHVVQKCMKVAHILRHGGHISQAQKSTARERNHLF